MIASIISQICFMKVIQLHLPDELAEKVLAITGNVETYILDVLRTNINEPKKPITLAQEYRLAGIENAELNKDFEHIDTEGWAF